MKRIRKESVPNNESPIKVIPIFNESEIESRHKEYENLSLKLFDSVFKDYSFKPVIIDYGSHTETIQYNYCYDTFCPNFGMPLKLIKPRGTRSIRNYVNTSVSRAMIPGLTCNIMEYVGATKRVSGNTFTLFSNWSIAEEIKRLETLSLTRPVKKKYTFHNIGCLNTSIPTDKDKSFVRYGKTKSGSIRYKCKTCGKITNVNDNLLTNFNYGQKRNDILLRVLDDVLLRIPIRKICERNEISPPTFYRKLEIIYQKCLQFLERHESKFKNLQFEDLYLTSDTFSYALNNIRKKGKGNKKKDNYEKAQANEALTSMNAVADVISNYVFRADLCYDTEISLEDIEKDTTEFHCDHTYGYLRKNQRIHEYSYHPKPPTKYDTQSLIDYIELNSRFETRKKFVNGLHVSKGYTSIAQLHILKKQLNYNRLVFVSDDDKSIRQAVFRVFKDDFEDNNAFYFLSSYSKSKKLKSTYVEAQETRRELIQFGYNVGYKKKGLYELAIMKLEHDLKSHKFVKIKFVNGVALPKPTNMPIVHPLPAKDEGNRYIRLISNPPFITTDDMAKLIVDVNMRAINNFFQELRRDINLFERPLVGARGIGKTYIYANYNPKYGHMLITIFRTYYNFIKVRKYYDGSKMTPAQRIGIVDKKYNLKDIIYFR